MGRGRVGTAPARTEASIGHAAMRVLDRDGILGGVSLQEVADEAGVSRPLINHYFGNRRILLRAALDTRRREFAEAAAGHHWRRPLARVRWAFQAIIEHRHYAKVMALLAIDGDEQFEALPWLDEIVAADRQWIAENVVVADADPAVGHAVFIALACGWSVFRESFARHFGISPEELDDKAWPTIRQMFEAFVIDSENEVDDEDHAAKGHADG